MTYTVCHPLGIPAGVRLDCSTYNVISLCSLLPWRERQSGTRTEIQTRKHLRQMQMFRRCQQHIDVNVCSSYQSSGYEK